MYIHQLKVTATEEDLTEGNFIPVDGQGGSKKIPVGLLAKNSDIDSLAGRTETLENYRTYSIRAGSVTEHELAELVNSTSINGELILNRISNGTSSSFYRKSDILTDTNDNGDSIATIVFSRNGVTKVYTAICKVNISSPSNAQVTFEFSEIDIQALFSQADGVTLSASEYARLEEQEKVDPNLKYYIYEDE